MFAGLVYVYLLLFSYLLALGLLWLAPVIDPWRESKYENAADRAKIRHYEQLMFFIGLAFAIVFVVLLIHGYFTWHHGAARSALNWFTLITVPFGLWWFGMILTDSRLVPGFARNDFKHVPRKRE
jgi:hypothetical protein